MRALTTILVILFFCTCALSSESGTASENQNIFSGSFADALWTVLAFVLVLAVLSKIAWKPMLKRLKDREQRIRQQIEAAENSRKLAEKMLEDHKQQSLQIIKQATDIARQREREITEKTRQDVLEIRRQAQEDIDKARAATVEQLWQQAGDIVLSLGKEVLGRVLTDNDNKQLIDEAVTKLRQE